MFATALFSQVTLRFILLGLATGSLTALVGLGVVLVYRASGVLNFAAGALGGVGAFICYSLRDDHDFPAWAAMAAGLLVGAVLGALTFAVIALIRQASLLSKLIATLALLTAAQGMMIIVWGSDLTQPDSFLPTDIVSPVGDLRIGEDRLILIVVVLVLAAVLRLVYSKTSFGLATSAVAENRQVAASAGWSTSTIEFVNFTLAGVLSALAAILLAPIVTLNATVLSISVLAALAAALVGRFSSFGITVGAALLIGAVQSLVALFQPDIASGFGVDVNSLAGLASVVPLVVILVYTVVSGRARLGRGDALHRLPLPGTGQVSLAPLAVGVVIAILLIARADTWADAFIITFGVGIILCSVIVVSGYAGQLSLCQYALAGFAAWVAGRLASGGTGFELSLLIGVAATVVAGVIVALPALRTRGVSLAIATLALALLINALVFSNSSLTGGLKGIQVRSPRLFGFDIGAGDHPQRYAAVLLVAFVLVGLLVANSRRGRSGRRMLAVRSNERAAAALGISVVGVKLYAFAFASGIAAIGGILVAFRHPAIKFDEFAVFGSILLVEFAVIGGLGWVAGTVAGATLAPGGLGSQLVNELAPNLENVASWLAILGAVGAVQIIRQSPDGIAAQWSRSPLGRLVAPLRVPRRISAGVDARPQPARPPAALAVDDITVRFGGVTAVDGVSFTIQPGEIVGVIGPNGAGKTTLLDAVTGFIRPERGTVRLDETDLSRKSPERRARAGVARSWQAVELFEEMTIGENLLIACDRHERSRFLSDLVHPGRQPFSALAQEVIDEFDLSSVLDQRPSSLPQGHARLVGIARAIVGQPAVLLLDEPAAGLSPDEGAELAAAIQTVARRHGIGVLVVEHDVPLLLGLCDRMVALDFGRKIAEGTPAEITANEHVVRSYLGEPERDVLVDAT